MVVYMRANDADRGLLADVASFTFIQEFAARLLGTEVGGYTHHIGSLHIAEGDLPRVKRVLAETEAGGRPDFAMPPMPTRASWADVTELLRIEESLRTNTAQYSATEIAALDLDPYWQQAVLLLETHRQITYCAADPVESEILTALHPGYQWLVRHRWPDRIPLELTR
jgi:thymidylate synthase